MILAVGVISLALGSHPHANLALLPIVSVEAWRDKGDSGIVQRASANEAVSKMEHSSNWRLPTSTHEKVTRRLSRGKGSLEGDTVDAHVDELWAFGGFVEEEPRVGGTPVNRSVNLPKTTSTAAEAQREKERSGLVDISLATTLTISFFTLVALFYFTNAKSQRVRNYTWNLLTTAVSLLNGSLAVVVATERKLASRTVH